METIKRKKKEELMEDSKEVGLSRVKTRSERKRGDKRREKDEGMKGGGGTCWAERPNNGAAHLMVNLNGG